MFGINDPGIYIAYLLIFLCAAFAIVFGIINWNKGKETSTDSLETDLKWEEKNERINQDITNK